MPAAETCGRLLVFTGLQAAGKTTIADLLASSHDWSVISSDLLRGKVRSRSPWGRMEELARSDLIRGRTVLIDATNYTRSHRQRFISVADQLGCPHLIVYLKADLTTLLDRNSSRERPIPRAAIIRMSRLFEPPEGAGVLEIDTRLLEPQQAASLIVERLSRLTPPRNQEGKESPI